MLPESSPPLFRRPPSRGRAEPGTLAASCRRQLAWIVAAAALTGPVAACSAADDDALRAEFRAKGDGFEIDRGDGKGWQPFFVRGINLAVAMPGTFPGELAAQRSDYLRWFDGIAAAHVNVIRLYTLHFPVFYETLREWNLAHPQTPLYVLQGVWLDEIEHCDIQEKHASGVTIGCDYVTERTAQLEEEVGYVIDAIHGDASVPERLGKAYGRFATDISPWVMGLLPGHEMDGFAVLAGNLRYAPYTVYQGRYLRMKQGSPMEGWVARGLDLVETRCRDRWGRSYPVGWSNWPALDPIHHPTEPSTFAQDVVDCDFGKFEAIGGFDRGVYVSYHVYPFNPEFIIHDPGYKAVKDASGKTNSYLGYLLDLKAHHPNVPVLIAELGIPSSHGVAHYNDAAYHHGGYSEAQQGEILVDQIDAAVDAGMAGTVVFEWIDEWFKRTWMCTPTMVPADHGPLWYDVISPEESFGVISYWPVPGMSRVVDGVADEWGQGAVVLGEQAAAPLASSGDGGDAARALRKLQVAHDPAWLFMHLALGPSSGAPTAAATLDKTVVLIGLSTIEGASGDRRLTLLPELQTAADIGFEAWLVIDRANNTIELRVDDRYDPTPRLNGGAAAGGRPEPNDNGIFQLARHIVNNNAQYIAENKGIIPDKRYYEAGRLRWGDTRTDTLAHIFGGAGGVVELRLPWHALWITDPPGRGVLFDDPATAGFDARASEGVRALVLTATRRKDGSLQVIDALPRAAWHPGKPLQASELPLFAWAPWTKVHTVERRKPAYDALSARYQALAKEQP